MSRACTFVPERNAIFVKSEGVLTQSRFEVSVALTVQDPRFRPNARMLLDFRDVTQFEVPAASLEAVVAQRYFNADSRHAFVVNPGFGEHFVSYWRDCGPVEQIGIFHSRAAALAWLNVGVAAEQHLVDLADPGGHSARREFPGVSDDAQ